MQLSITIRFELFFRLIKFLDCQTEELFPVYKYTTSSGVTA